MPSSGFYDAQWIPQPLVYTWINTTQFSTPGDYTNTFEPGVRIMATVSAGIIYGTVVTRVFAAGITTVTCVWDAGVLDVGLSAVATGIITPFPNENAMPITVVVTVTGDRVFVPAEMNRIWIANKATAISFTLPLPTDVPSGAWFKFINIGAGTLTVVGVISGSTDPPLHQYDEITCVSDGTAWRGQLLQKRPAELSAAGATAATALNMGTVVAGERYLVVVFAWIGWAGTKPNYAYTLTAKSAGTATVSWNSGAVSANELLPQDLSPGSTYTTLTDVLKVTTGGTLTITNTITAVGGGPMGVTTYTNDVYTYRLKHLE
jgi:hypothetical protein